MIGLSQEKTINKRKESILWKEPVDYQTYFLLRLRHLPCNQVNTYILAIDFHDQLLWPSAGLGSSLYPQNMQDRNPRLKSSVSNRQMAVQGDFPNLVLAWRGIGDCHKGGKGGKHIGGVQQIQHCAGLGQPSLPENNKWKGKMRIRGMQQSIKPMSFKSNHWHPIHCWRGHASSRRRGTILVILLT